MSDEMSMIDVHGNTHCVPPFSIYWMLGAGWIFMFLSFILNLIFYMIHPSSPGISLDDIKRRIKGNEDGELPYADVQLEDFEQAYYNY